MCASTSLPFTVPDSTHPLVTWGEGSHIHLDQCCAVLPECCFMLNQDSPVWAGGNQDSPVWEGASSKIGNKQSPKIPNEQLLALCVMGQCLSINQHQTIWPSRHLWRLALHILQHPVVRRHNLKTMKLTLSFPESQVLWSNLSTLIPVSSYIYLSQIRKL